MYREERLGTHRWIGEEVTLFGEDKSRRTMGEGKTRMDRLIYEAITQVGHGENLGCME
jgi:hypothetical protein